MAIEINCPNGHRVSVKEIVGGGAGRCPTCGATFRITSEAKLPVARLVSFDPAKLATLPRARAHGTAGPATHVSERPQSPPAVAPSTVDPISVDPISVDPISVDPISVDPISVDTGRFAPAPQSAPMAPATPARLHAVIAEHPDIAWCIAFPGGEPTEPLDAPTMQAWLDGGHATGEEVVWRADWPEWQPVRDVFPEFFGNEFRF